jgi:electron transport complex protein RnfB
VTTYVIDTDTCIQCGVCEADCTENAIFEGPDGYTIDQTKCSGCGNCHDSCPVEAANPAA